MATSKVTFTLDETTIHRLQDTAARLGLAKSEVVRESIAEFYAHLGRLSERERLRMLRAFDTLVPRIPSRSAAGTDREIRDVRAARRGGGRRSARRKRS